MGEVGSIHVVAADRPEADLLAWAASRGRPPPWTGLEEASGGRWSAWRRARAGRGRKISWRRPRRGRPGRWSPSTASAHAQELLYAKLARWLGTRRRGGAPERGAAADRRAAGPRRDLRRRPPAASCAPWRSSAYRFDRFLERRRRRAPRRPARRGAAGGRGRGLPRGPARGGRWPARSPSPATSPTRPPTRRPPPGWRSAPASSPASRGLDVHRAGADELRARGMGGLLAVGAGSAHEPRMVRLRYGDRGPRVALVGKGMTFDTGGISIKTAADMDEMKYDKAGACAVLAAARAVADLEPAGAPVRLRPVRREHAERRRLPAERHRALLQRQDGGDHQHRRRGADDPRRRPRLGRRGGPRRDASSCPP